MSTNQTKDRGALAETLRRFRKLADLTQRGVANESGVSQATIRDLALGNQTQTNPETLRFLARGLTMALFGEAKADFERDSFTILMVATHYQTSFPDRFRRLDIDDLRVHAMKHLPEYDAVSPYILGLVDP